MRLRLAVFASGGGSNLQALLDSFQNRSDSPIRVVLVVSDQPHAGALERARRANVENVVIPVAGRPADFVARETLAALESADVDLIALAGYLRLIPQVIVKRYRQRMVNIHPALLPAFGGKGMYGARVHQAVIDAGCTISGATVHLVDEQYDQGRIIAQWPVPVLPNDDPKVWPTGCCVWSTCFSRQQSKRSRTTSQMTTNNREPCNYQPISVSIWSTITA